MLKMLNMLKIKILARENKTYLNLFYFRDRPFNLQGGGYGFLFSSEIFSGQHELEYLFFLSRKAQFFFPEINIRLYDKNSESDSGRIDQTKKAKKEVKKWN